MIVPDTILLSGGAVQVPAEEQDRRVRTIPLVGDHVATLTTWRDRIEIAPPLDGARATCVVVTQVSLPAALDVDPLVGLGRSGGDLPAALVSGSAVAGLPVGYWWGLALPGSPARSVRHGCRCRTWASAQAEADEWLAAAGVEEYAAALRAREEETRHLLAAMDDPLPPPASAEADIAAMIAGGSVAEVATVATTPPPRAAAVARTYAARTRRPPPVEVVARAAAQDAALVRAREEAAAIAALSATARRAAVMDLDDDTPMAVISQSEVSETARRADALDIDQGPVVETTRERSSRGHMEVA